jgi:thymidylate synthase (FAD)
MSNEEPVPETPQDLVRPRADELDKILGKVFPVLDEGFVRVVDYMGNDGSIVQAARVSYGIGTKQLHEDRGLIRFLMRHRHTSPFEMCELKLHIKVPMDCWRQWIRHRTANVNEYSTRYSIAIDAAQKTRPTEWRLQATTNRQGSTGAADESLGEHLTQREEALQREARGVYEERIKAGVAKEQARKDLPLSTYTMAYWKIDLHNLLHFLSLRMHEHAQQEIREYANVIGNEIVARWCPVAWEAFKDYRMGAVSLTRIELEVTQAVIKGDTPRAKEIASAYGMLDAGGTPVKGSRERTELEAKLGQLGLAIPWA